MTQPNRHTDSNEGTGAPPQDFSQLAHRRMIGWLGLLLPILLVVLAGVRPTHGMPRWELLGSISAYYYTGAVPLFAGALVALSLFLMTYRGYQGEQIDQIVGAVAGVAALGVAFFPTTAPGWLGEPGWWRPLFGTIHIISAIVLFIAFIAFSIWLFRKSSISDPEQRPRDKRRRNAVYLICGIVMIVCIAWALFAGGRGGSIFWPESIALVAFAISWLVKGEAAARLQQAVGLVEKAE